MDLPALAPGKRYTLPRPFGSADALLLARFAEQRAAQGQITAVISAEPADTQRLQDELAGTENRISVERRRYNEEVEIFRSYARSLIGGLFIKIRGIDWQRYDYFKAQEGAETAPKVKFD